MKSRQNTIRVHILVSYHTHPYASNVISNHIHTYVRMYVCIYVCMYMCMYVYVYVCTSKYVIRHEKTGLCAHKI